LKQRWNADFVARRCPTGTTIASYSTKMRILFGTGRPLKRHTPILGSRR